MDFNPFSNKPRKIIHVDMDCFYAAIEIRDHPSLANKPVAVGGPSNRRGVICTCNYIARNYGIHAAMPTSLAYRHCKELIVLPVDMPRYKRVAKNIHDIFSKYTDLVEPLALDEAYLDVTNSSYHKGSATLIAETIRKEIWETEKLTASAGISSNKFLAKIASGWRKPNGLYVIHPNDIETFIKTLPVNELYGVGKVTAKKLHQLQLITCADLQRLTLAELTCKFGKLGQRLYEQCRGIDDREIEPNKIRKSLSVERTFPEDLYNREQCSAIFSELYNKLQERIKESAPNLKIKSQFIKIKFNNFKLTTAETTTEQINLERYLALFLDHSNDETKPIRLLGMGVHFRSESLLENSSQQSFPI